MGVDLEEPAQLWNSCEPSDVGDSPNATLQIDNISDAWRSAPSAQHLHKLLFGQVTVLVKVRQLAVAVQFECQEGPVGVHLGARAVVSALVVHWVKSTSHEGTLRTVVSSRCLGWVCMHAPDAATVLTMSELGPTGALDCARRSGNMRAAAVNSAAICGGCRMRGTTTALLVLLLHALGVQSLLQEPRLARQMGCCSLHPGMPAQHADLSVDQLHKPVGPARPPTVRDLPALESGRDHSGRHDNQRMTQSHTTPA
eukprot:1201944-Rhodomonas_salina.1